MMACCRTSSVICQLTEPYFIPIWAVFSPNSGVSSSRFHCFPWVPEIHSHFSLIFCFRILTEIAGTAGRNSNTILNPYIAMFTFNESVCTEVSPITNHYEQFQDRINIVYVLLFIFWPERTSDISNRWRFTRNDS